MLELAFGTIQRNSLSPSLDIICILVTLQSALSICFCSFSTSIPIVYILSCYNRTVYNQCPAYLIYPACRNQPFDISSVIQPHASRIAPIGSASRRIRYPFRRIYAFTIERRQHICCSKRELYLQALKDSSIGFKSGEYAGKKRI